MMQPYRTVAHQAAIEHHPEIIRHADWVVELGPQGRQQGGEVIFQGSFKALLKSPQSVTAPFLK